MLNIRVALFSRSTLTNLYRKARRKPKVDKISESGEVGAGAGHQVNDGCDLLHQRQRMFLTHPQSAFKPDSKTLITLKNCDYRAHLYAV